MYVSMSRKFRSRIILLFSKVDIIIEVENINVLNELKNVNS